MKQNLSVLAAVAFFLAAGLAFGGYQLWKQQPELFELTEQETPVEPGRAAEQVLADLKRAESVLAQVYEEAKTGDADSVVKRAADTIDEVARLYEELGEHEELDSQIERTAQVTSMRCYFLAGKIIPSYRSACAAMAKQIIEQRPDTDDAAQAKIILFCQKHALHKPLDFNTLAALYATAKAFESPAHGVSLFAVSAHELWSSGHANSARKVLQTGIRMYKGKPGQSQLMDQMVAQVAHDQPPPELTEKRYDELMSAIDRMVTRRPQPKPKAKANTPACGVRFR